LNSPKPPTRVYVKGAVFKRSSNPIDIQSSSPILPNHSLDPINRARALVQQFHQARADPATAAETRRALRRQARTEKVYSEFQALLNKQDPSNLELKCSERR
jgi:hypothetical protein